MIEVGVLQVTLHLQSSHSLKEKRHVVRSIKDRLRARFNISIAEVDDQDEWQSAVLGVAFVANDHRFVEQVLSQVKNHIDENRDVEMIDSMQQIL